jgi:preprotein translocase subunit SecA
MDWAGLDEDVPIDNGMINKSIENAQVKVEAFHFDMRKHLVEFDDVVNTHREVIYGERDKILSGADLKGNIQKMLADQIGEIVAGTLGDSRPSDWDIDSFLAEVGTVIPPPEEFFDDDYLVGMDVDAVESSLLEHAERTYDEMEAALTPEVMRDLERHLLLRSIDTNWVQHLTTMENLRQGIGLHAYGQRDPLVMYRKEGMDQFQLLEQKIQSDVAHSIFRVQITMGQSFANGSRSRRQRPAPQPIRAAAPSAKGGRKVGRNQPCPCGSGKKYKRCHGGGS